MNSQTRDPVGLSGGRLAEAVRELKALASNTAFFADALEEILQMIDWIDDFEQIPTSAVSTILASSVSRPRQVLRFRDRFMRKGKNTLTAYDASEGALYALFSAVLALLPKAPRCVAVDNLDQALNPRLTQKLVSSLCKWILTRPLRGKYFLWPTIRQFLTAFPFPMIG